MKVERVAVPFGSEKPKATKHQRQRGRKAGGRERPRPSLSLLLSAM